MKCQFSFRLDDITADMNWKNFIRIREIFEQNNICPLLGIVPDNHDKKLQIGESNPRFWNTLKELEKQGWVMAQHGFQHTYLTEKSGLLGLKEASEFAGRTYKEQRKALEQGRRILRAHGIVTDVFMAPGHTYDENTLKALYDLEFRYVTDGFSNDCYIRKGLIFIPCKSAERPCGRGIDTLCLHINSMKEQQFLELEKMIRRNRKYIVNFGRLMEEKPKRYGMVVRVQEKANLKKRRMRLWVAQSEIMQSYLQKYRGASRIVFLPILIWKFFKENVQKGR